MTAVVSADDLTPEAAPGRAGWLVVALLLLVQFAIFREVVRREVAPFVPTRSDQAFYLHHAYADYENVLDRGPWQGGREAVANAPVTGVLMHLQAVGLLLALGPGRFTVLLPHFLYLALFECVLVAVLLRWTRRWGCALFGLGLLLSAASPWGLCGGLFDFRIDGLAFSLYGIFLGLWLLSDGFASRPWSLAVAAAACVLILFRYLMVVHLTGCFVVWFAITFARWLLAVSGELRQSSRRRLVNATMAGLITAAVSAAVLGPQHRALWAYYGVGHLTGAEKDVRAAELNVLSWADSLLYYPISFVRDHAGATFLVVAAIGLAGAAWLWWRRGAVPGRLGGARAAVLAGLGLLVPAVVLTANTAKSPVVGNVLLAALLWLCLVPFAAAAARTRATLALRGLAAVALAAAVLNLLQASTWRDHYSSRSSAEYVEVVPLHDDLARECVARGWTSPCVSSDVVTDFLPPNTLGVPAYERQGLRLQMRRGLGSAIFEICDEQARGSILASDLVLVRDGPDLTPAVYPITRTLARIRPWVREHCREHMEVVGDYRIRNQTFTLYARPCLKASGGEGGWVTSRGLTLRGRAETLRRFPVVRLRGEAMPVLPRTPTAQVRLGGQAIAARMTFPDPRRYVIEFEVPRGAVAGDGPVELRLGFDAHFVPRDLGMNDDGRSLVVREPAQIELHRRSEVGMAANLDKAGASN